MKITKRDVDLLWEAMYILFEEGSIDEVEMSEFEEFINHISFMHVLTDICKEKEHEDEFWKLYEKYVHNKH
jgi:hypothetical protein